MNLRLDCNPQHTLIGINVATTLRDGLNHRDIPAAWRRVFEQNLFAKIPGQHDVPRAFFGAIYGFDDQSTDFNYLIGLAVPAGTAVPEGYATLTINPGDYAVLTTAPTQSESDFIAAIGQGWSDLKQWQASAPYRHDVARIGFEYYDERGEPGQAERTMEIWWPVAKP
ncbi:GyrI-like domain-containing protein [Jeongeupia chitinilytica]|uniref:AraC effector-binding domain-containing protein n=1 Tax=Jeongeupia chitinilytica TaxID=1041641 RepID=A0ABQ3GVG4_9NEIS|nr:effector binding domain-containing protein [Jeongeupia chitinilytica]GHD56787.1 hypothetical protein GCM10007350_04500 [Jeongeupia chitinilytica]